MSLSLTPSLPVLPCMPPSLLPFLPLLSDCLIVCLPASLRFFASMTTWLFASWPLCPLITQAPFICLSAFLLPSLPLYLPPSVLPSAFLAPIFPLSLPSSLLTLKRFFQGSAQMSSVGIIECLRLQASIGKCFRGDQKYVTYKERQISCIDLIFGLFFILSRIY